MKLNDHEVFAFEEENEMLDYLRQQEITDIWKEVVTNEITALPVEDVDPIFIRTGAIPVSYKGTAMNGSIAENVTDDDILESSKDPKLMVAIPNDSGMVVYPMRYTAFSGIQSRAGITGRAISRLDDYGQQTEMSASNRAACINMGLELYRNRTKVLIRQNNPYDANDGVKVTAMMSGDENDYSILEQYRLVKALRGELQTAFSNFKYAGGQTSYEITSISYDLDDDALRNQIANTLTGYGQPVAPDDVKVTVRLTTSDCGLCQARLTPIIIVAGIPMMIGSVKEVKHQNKADIAKFCDVCSEMLIHFRDNLKSIEELGKVKITNPSECFKRVYEKLGLSGYRNELLETMERIESEHALGCTGYDIYWYFCEMLYKKEMNTVPSDGKDNIFKSIKAQETVASILRMDLKEYDY